MDLVREKEDAMDRVRWFTEAPHEKWDFKTFQIISCEWMDDIELKMFVVKRTHLSLLHYNIAISLTESWLLYFFF